MSRRYIPFTLFMLLILSLLLPAKFSGRSVFRVWANASPDTRTVTLKDLGYANDESIQGILVSRDFTVNWPDAWQVQPGNLLTVRFSHSPALNPNSSMAVDWNGTRLGSILLTPENVENGSLEISIPENLIQTGYNNLHFEFFLTIKDEICEDPDNPALWATIHNTTAFDFSYSWLTPQPDLAKFPVPFLDNSRLVENVVTFVIPEQPLPAELNAVSAISAKLGQLAAWRTLKVDVLSEAQTAEVAAVKGDLIVVGRSDRLQMLTTSSLPFVVLQDGKPILLNSQNQVLPPEAGVLFEQVSPGDQTSLMMIVTGATDAAMLTAARTVASDLTIARLSGPLGVVLQVPEPAPVILTGAVSFTFKQLGYEDITAQGTREQTLNYAIPLPFAWQVQTGAALELHFAHSELVHPKRSSLNVLLNGSPVGSILLSPENANNAIATFQLPARLFKIGTNQLTLVSNIQIDKDFTNPNYCREKYYREAWLVIYSDSTVNLPGNPANVFLALDRYPRGFIGSTNLSELVFIVPDVSDLQIGRLVAQISERIGHYAAGDTIFPGVMDAQTLANTSPPPAFQILVGRPTQNSAISALNDKLPQPFKAGTDDPERIATLAQVLSSSGSTGYIQVVQVADGKPRLVVTGNTAEGVSWAGEALSTPELGAKLRGNLAVLDNQGALTAMETRPEPAPAALPAGPKPSTQSAGLRFSGWVIWLAGGIVLAAIAILVVIALLEIRRSRKS